MIPLLSTLGFLLLGGAIARFHCSEREREREREKHVYLDTHSTVCVLSNENNICFDRDT